MKYEEFKSAWEEALHDRKLLPLGGRPEETIDLATMTRRSSVRVGTFGSRQTEPFFASMELKWAWDALLAARTRTTEEDLLNELLGTRSRRIATERPWLRIDVELAGTLPWDEPIRMPGQGAWQAWVHRTMASVNPLLPVSSRKTSPEGLPVVEGWLGEPEAQVRVKANGELLLSGVKLHAWQAINPPRNWDDPSRKPDASPSKQLDAFARRLHDSLEAWKGSLKVLLALPANDEPGHRLH